jgi:hypothetical protein
LNIASSSAQLSSLRFVTLYHSMPTTYVLDLIIVLMQLPLNDKHHQGDAMEDAVISYHALYALI